MNVLDKLGAEPVICHGLFEVGFPFGREDKADSAGAGEQPSGAVEELLYIQMDLMAGNGFLGIRIQPPACPFFIGRV